MKTYRDVLEYLASLEPGMWANAQPPHIVGDEIRFNRLVYEKFGRKLVLSRVCKTRVAIIDETNIYFHIRTFFCSCGECSEISRIKKTTLYRDAAESQRRIWLNEERRCEMVKMVWAQERGSDD